MSETFSWDGDWYEVTSETERQELDDELVRELSPGHVLYGSRASAMGRRWRRDDVLFRLEDGRYAQVHLTRRKEANPIWPSTDVFASFADWQSVPVEDR